MDTVLYWYPVMEYSTLVQYGTVLCCIFPLCPYCDTGTSYILTGVLTDRDYLECSEEAQRDAASEPLLSSFLYASILAHETFERSLAFVLANRLANPTMLPTQLFEIFLGVLSGDDNVRCGALADLEACRERVRGICGALVEYLGAFRESVRGYGRELRDAWESTNSHECPMFPSLFHLALNRFYAPSVCTLLVHYCAPLPEVPHAPSSAIGSGMRLSMPCPALLQGLSRHPGTPHRACAMGPQPEGAGAGPSEPHE